MAAKTSPRHQRTQPTEHSASRRIVAAARRYFLAHGFRNVTMDDLAEELGMSKKTLYACYPSKSALVEAVLQDKFLSVETDLARIGSEHPSDALAHLHQLLACVQHHTEEIRPPFVRDIRRAAPELFKLVEKNRRRLIQRHFGKLFEQGRREGIIRKDIPTRVMIEILLGATEAVVNPAKMAELGLTPKSGYTSVITVVLEGVVTARGRSKL